jgi:hypothetical protein
MHFFFIAQIVSRKEALYVTLNKLFIGNRLISLSLVSKSRLGDSRLSTQDANQKEAPVCQALTIRASFNRDPPSMGVPLGWLFLAR